MEKCSELQLLLIVCSLLLVCRCQNDQFCPVVTEGSQFSHSCVAPSDSGFIIWELTDERTMKPVEITRCALNGPDCDSSVKPFSVRNERLSSKEYNSTLQAPIAVYDYRFYLLTCRYTEHAFSPPVFLASCKMAVYRAGNTVNCTGRLQQDGSIYLDCTNAYPVRSCYYYERLNSSLTRSRNMTAKNRTREDSTSLSLFQSSCTEVLYPLGPGIYNYDFYLDFGQGYLKSENASTRLDVRAKPRVTVGVSPEWAPLCQKRTEVEVKCSVTFMRVVPKFQFFMREKELTNLSVSTFRQGSSEFTTYEVVRNVEVTQGDSGKLMRCLVHFWEGSELSILNDTKFLWLSWPPPAPPMLTGDGGVDVPLGNALEIKEGSSSRVACAVKGGNPPVSSIDITCKTQSHVVFSNRSHSGSVSATIQGNATYHRTICVCSALHGSNCYNSTTEIQIKVMPLGATTPAPKKPQGAGKNSYIVVGAVSLVVIVVVVVVVCVVCRHGDSLYSSSNEYANDVRPLRRCCCCRLKRSCPPPQSNVAPELPPPRIKPRLGIQVPAPNAAAGPPSLVRRASAREWRDDPELEIENNDEGPCIVYKADKKPPLGPLKAAVTLPVNRSTSMEPKPHATSSPAADYLHLLPPETNELRPHEPLTAPGYIPMSPPRRKESQPLLGAPRYPAARPGGAGTPPDSPSFRERAGVKAPSRTDNHSFSSLGFQPPPCGCPV